MPAWTAFAVVAGALTVLVLVLARATAAAIDASPSSDSHSSTDPRPKPDRRTTTELRDPASERHVARATPAWEPSEAWGWGRVEDVSGDGSERSRASGGQASGFDGDVSLSSFSTRALLANVVVTHGLFAAVLVAAAVLASIPPAALGIAPTPWSTGLPAIGAGIALGVGLYAANVAIAAVLDRADVGYSEELRKALAPDTALGWLALLGVALPLIAVFEEVLFRAALIGAVSTGFGVSPWLLVVLSSIAFALGHGIQGPGGVLVTGLLGSVLGVAFVLSESLLAVVIAHYAVNALEFVVHEGLDVDPESQFS